MAVVALASSSASGQSAEPHACTYFPASDLLRITGRKDITQQGPQASKPGETAAGTTECDFLSISMTVTSNMTPEWFARDKKMLEQGTRPWKVQPVSGLGDEAYYMSDQRSGPERSVGLAYRKGTKRVTVGSQVPADSLDAIKPMLMEIAKLALPKVR
jgi:hypothetical protein